MRLPLIALLTGIALSALGAQWKPAPAPLMTRWAEDVSPRRVHPEYPRPQMVRAEWQSLNGLWNFAITPKEAARPESWAGDILVPFPVESALSGVGRRLSENERLWYRRVFRVPRGWRRQRLLLHFGASDWETSVHVNGKPIGTHRGGYDSFSFDITDALEPGAEQELIVSVWDPTDAGTQPRGKQVRRPGGIWYVPTSGIWQTVWLEPVNETRIQSFTIVPDIDAGTVAIEARLTGGARVSLEATALDGRRTVSRANSAGARVTLRVPRAKLWSPDSPFLYGLKLVASVDGRTVDEVESYFGMRKIGLGKDDKGIWRLFLNNEPLFQYGPLDQGFWPDGLYTAPTDEALRFDIEMTKRLGFNMTRKHVKIEPARWYYWCDRLGLLVWQDMPSGDRHIGANDADLRRSAESAAQYELELRRMIEGLQNHPSIVMWVPFNEGWGQFDTERIARWVKELDPTRLVNSVSGWADRNVGDVYDLHNYPGPIAPKLQKDRAVVLGEFGGLGLPIKGHTWQDERNWGYRNYSNRDELTVAYLRLMEKLHPLTGDAGLAAAVYTQLTDVEGEVNGLLTYDRAVLKMDRATLVAAAQKLHTPPVPLRLERILPAADHQPARWRYTTNEPAMNWFKPEFSDRNWAEGASGFGTHGTPGAVIGTVWNTSDIWLRCEVKLTAGQARAAQLWLHHDENVEIYVNGIEVFRTAGYLTEYERIPLTPAAKKAFKPGRNVIAVHCHQTGGGQYIDLGLVAVSSDAANQ